MALLINKGTCAVKCGGMFFIPGKAVEVNIDEMKKSFPQIGNFINNKILVEVSKASAEKIQSDYKKQTQERLKEKAETK